MAVSTAICRRGVPDESVELVQEPQSHWVVVRPPSYLPFPKGSSLGEQINLPIVLVLPSLPPCGLPLLEGLYLGDGDQGELA
jgi:hypothetical protein